MGFQKHMGGIRWKILEIMWCKKSNLISKCAGEPVFLLWLEHITQWANSEATQVTEVHVTYPRWRFVPESRIKAIMTSPMVELSESQKKIKNMALRATELDPMDPKAPEILAEQKEARDAAFHGNPKSEAPAPSSSQVKRKSGNTPKEKPAKSRKIDSPAPIPKDQKNQITELKQKLRDTEDELKSARDRVTRLKNKEDDMQKLTRSSRRNVRRSWRTMTTCKA